MSMIGMLFGGRAQLCEETWEPFSMTAQPDEDYCAAEWADIITRAQRLGVETKFTTKGLKMSYGKSSGTFRDYQGGVRLAEEFLEGLE